MFFIEDRAEQKADKKKIFQRKTTDCGQKAITEVEGFYPKYLLKKKKKVMVWLYLGLYLV